MYGFENKGLVAGEVFFIIIFNRFLEDFFVFYFYNFRFSGFEVFSVYRSNFFIRK